MNSGNVVPSMKMFRCTLSRGLSTAKASAKFFKGRNLRNDAQRGAVVRGQASVIEPTEVAQSGQQLGRECAPIPRPGPISQRLHLHRHQHCITTASACSTPQQPRPGTYRRRSRTWSWR